MKLFCAVLLASALPAVLSQAGDSPTTASRYEPIPSATPTLDPSWRHNRTRQRKHVHDFFRLFGWLRTNETIPDRDIAAAIRKIQRILRAPETGVYDERMEAVMSRPRCDTFQPYNATDASKSRPSKKDKRYVLWGPKWHHQTITYRFVNYTSEVPADRQRAVLSNAFAKWNQYLPINIVPAGSDVSRPDIHVRFMNLGPNEPRYGFTNMIADGLTLSSGLINITFNDNYDWNDDRLFDYTALHEVGHALGLSHSKVEDSVMWPYFEGIIRPLHPDDKAAVHSLYGWKDPRWSRIDMNSQTNFIAQVSSTTDTPSNYDGLYQLRSNGQVLFYTSSGTWTTIDSGKNTVQITGSGGKIYQRRADGSIYRYTGSGSNWQNIGNPSDNVIDIVAAADQVYQRRKDGWIARYSGSGTTWTSIEEPRSTKQIAITDSKTLWNLLTNGDLVRSEWPYNRGWTLVDINELNTQIATGGDEFYKLQADGLVVWLDLKAYQWLEIEQADSVAIYAAGTYLYSRHSDGSIWRYTGTPGVWEELDSAWNTVSVIGDRRGSVWEMKGNGDVLRLVS